MFTSVAPLLYREIQIWFALVYTIVAVSNLTFCLVIHIARNNIMKIMKLKDST
uniref:Uncharacterized protein n=1 Tax=Anguilla anguilla TaxID=7936 RepID=A0A0E9P6F0_ANGAN